MFRNGIPLAIIFIPHLGGTLGACAGTQETDRSLRIKLESHLQGTKGIVPASEDGTVTMPALSYPSALKFYTETEVLRIIRFTCDRKAVLPRLYNRSETALSIEWNFTGQAKGMGGTTVQGVPRFAATLTELEPGVLSMTCDERVY